MCEEELYKLVKYEKHKSNMEVLVITGAKHQRVSIDVIITFKDRFHDMLHFLNYNCLTEDMEQFDPCFSLNDNNGVPSTVILEFVCENVDQLRFIVSRINLWGMKYSELSENVISKKLSIQYYTPLSKKVADSIIEKVEG